MKHITTLSRVEIKVGKLLCYETAFYPSSKTNLHYINLQLRSCSQKQTALSSHTDSGMLSVGTKGCWCCCFCRLAGCRGYKIPTYSNRCSSSYVYLVSVLLQHWLFWEVRLDPNTDVQMQRFLKSFHCYK